jgi:3-hydroxyacyl-[acyl-carrier-protein] dehydratase
MEDSWTKLALGADVVQMLLPHRRPFLLVDAIDAIALGPKPMLRARKMVSANEPVFEGHFPGLSLWPGVYTIEGLGQTTNLLNLIGGLIEAAATENIAPDAVLDALRGLEKRVRPGASKPTAGEERLVSALGAPRSRIGYAGAIDVKLMEPVFAGCVLEYRVTQTHVIANARRFDVEARVGDRPVARGTVTSATP